ncbi:MAG TPA: hypothetical protein VG984_03545 [Candidatus Paceibacterota bacterium]|nr:hypothetical protein [Candidatus Paceibacterota bacterium]
MESSGLDKEYAHFQSILPDLLSKGKAGSYALVHSQELIDIFPSEKEAYEAGISKFGTAVFLVQLITAEGKPESIQFLLHVNAQ